MYLPGGTSLGSGRIRSSGGERVHKMSGRCSSTKVRTGGTVACTTGVKVLRGIDGLFKISKKF